MFIRLTVSAASSQSLNLSDPAASLTAADLNGFASVSSVSKGASASCSTTFWPQAPLSSCFDAASPWRWQFDNSASSFSLATGTLAPGQSADFLLGSFFPQNGPVAPGVYSFSSASFVLFANGLDAGGAKIDRSFYLGETCAGFSATCAFTRTVVAVPEPSTYGLMAVGLAGLIGWRRRSR
ncbi:MAG: PEP-CTERM sorting domain-containing protein [Rubrivivax sp.]